MPAPAPMYTQLLPRLAAVAALVALVGPVLADEKKVEAPPAIKAAVEKAYPGAKIRECEQEDVEGTTYVEVTIETKQGKKVELTLLASGKIVEIREPVAVEAVPPAVLKAFAAKYPKSKPLEAKKLLRIDANNDKNRQTFYEISFQPEGAGAPGKGKDAKPEAGEEEAWEATFSEDGKFESEDHGE